MKKIDTHCHVSYQKYQEELERRGRVSYSVRPYVEEASLLEWEGYAEARISDMDKFDIERQVLSIPSFPSSSFGDDEFNRYWAQAINDFLTQFCHKYPDRFSVFISVPIRNVNHAIDELKRVSNVKGVVGVSLGSHIGETMLDSPELMPFYEEVDKRRLTLFIHPVLPIGAEQTPGYGQFADIYQFIGFLFDTTMAVTRMVYRGIFERYQNMNLIASHYGGMLPFVCPSIDIMREKMSRENLEIPPKLPSEYFKRFFADTARPLTAATLQCTLALFGKDHILFGSDMPNWMEEFQAPRRIITTIDGCDLPAQTKENIFYQNAKNLLKL